MPLRALLVLYTLDRSARCESAWSAVVSAWRRFDGASIELSVRNLSRVVDRTAADRRILIVPTLVMVMPQEHQLIGEFTTDDVIELLSRVGLEPCRKPRS